MLSSAALHSQLTAIMEVLTKAAVAEICRLVDDGYAVLRLEVSRSQKENEALKRKLSTGMMEASPAGPDRPSGEGLLNTPSDLHREGAPTALGKRDVRGQSDLDVRMRKCTEVKRTESQNIKEEGFEEDLKHCELQDNLAIRVGRAVESDLQAPDEEFPVDHTEALSEEHRMRDGAWSIGGLGAILKVDPEDETDVRTAQLAGHQGGVGKVRGRVVCERPGPVERETEDAPHHHAHSESRVPMLGPFPECTGNTLPTPGSHDEKPDVQQSSAWAKDVVLGAVHISHRHQREDRPTEKSQEGSFSKIGPLQTKVSERETLSKSFDGPGMSGYPLCEENPSTAKSFHQKTDCREKRFVCTYCGKSFTCLKNLETHQRVHTGERPFSCSQCGKRFSQSAHLKKHQSVHTGEKPFSCAKCGKCFADSSNLKRHQNVHTGERPFRCVQCGKRFSLIGNLKRHQGIHIGKKPYGNVMWEGFVF